MPLALVVNENKKLVVEELPVSNSVLYSNQCRSVYSIAS
jgi:hypothetical protein